jgi:hypothetical protein
VKARTVRLSLDASSSLYSLVSEIAEELDCTRGEVLRKGVRALKAMLDARKAERLFRPQGAKTSIVIL